MTFRREPGAALSLKDSREGENGGRGDERKKKEEEKDIVIQEIDTTKSCTI